MAAADARDDEAWSLYHSAYQAAARGDDATARRLLGSLIQRHADHPAARLSSQVLGSFDGPGGPPSLAPTPRQDEPSGSDRPAPAIEPERPTRGARAELALWQTLNGISLGVEFCVAVECDEAAAVFGGVLLGGGLGLGISLAAFPDGLQSGRRAALNSGTAWGAYNAALLVTLEDDLDQTPVGFSLIGGQIGGLVIGDGIWRGSRATAGQVALTNTFGIWAGVLTTFTLIAADSSPFDSDGTQLLQLLASDAALVVGGLTAARLPAIQRGQTLLIDAGGIVGGLTGLGITVLVSEQGEPDDQFVAGGVAIGAAAGLAAAAYFSRRWYGRADTVEPPARMTLMPTQGGGLSAGVAFDIDL